MTNQPYSSNFSERVSKAVAHYWHIRWRQHEKQKQSGHADQGARSAVTGGAQMDGFIDLFSQAIIEAGIDEQFVFRKKALDLPGYFRPTKEWDLLVIKNGLLIAAIEAKSQVGPSFGNNFNNRTEEAMGSALDLWTAFREGAFSESSQPFLGYFFMLEDCAASQHPVRVQEPHLDFPRVCRGIVCRAIRAVLQETGAGTPLLRRGVHHLAARRRPETRPVRRARCRPDGISILTQIRPRGVGPCRLSRTGPRRLNA